MYLIFLMHMCISLFKFMHYPYVLINYNRRKFINYTFVDSTLWLKKIIFINLQFNSNMLVEKNNCNFNLNKYLKRYFFILN